MIRLVVADYCQECLDFTPNVISPHKERTNGGADYHMTDTIIECKNRNRCSAIKRYLEQQMRSESREV